MSTSHDPPLPAHANAWLTTLLETSVPREQRATCTNCAMCPSEVGPPAAAYPFRPDVKCCVYLPEFPNFLVGQILADTDPEMADGQRTLRARIEDRISVTPLGVGRPPAFRLHYDNTVNAIGRSTGLRCPHFRVERGDCGVWKYRDHTCSTYFCKHDRGRLGHAFWNAVRLWLQAIEAGLARWCMLQLEVSAPQLQRTLAPPLSLAGKYDGDEIDGTVSAEQWHLFWGEWNGREEAFYLACAELVAALSWEEVALACGPTVQALAQVVRAAWSDLERPIPERLRVGSYQLLGVTADGISAITYASSDPVAVPQVILTVLHYVDGRPWTQIAADLERERGIKLTDELLRQLVDFGIFLEA